MRKLAERFGISRTTPLYHDRIGLLRLEQRSRVGSCSPGRFVAKYGDIMAR